MKGIQQTKDPIQLNFMSKKDKIYDLITNEITSWKHFGRLLGITDSELRNIQYEFRHEDSIEIIIFKILDEAEARHGSNMFDKLCDAVKKSKRLDIFRQITRIMETSH